MGKLVHNLTACVFAILSSLTALANHDEILLQNLPGDSLPGRKQADSASTAKKICSCRLMEVRSDTYDLQLVGIFAEKTLVGKKSGNYKILNQYLQREKSYFRFIFLESLKQKQTYRTSSNCKELYKELKLKHTNLVMYNIIDVDALRIMARR